MLIIFEYKVPADVVAVDGDLAVSALLLAAVQQRLLLVQALVVVRDLPHLQHHKHFSFLYSGLTIHLFEHLPIWLKFSFDHISS